MAKGTFYSVHKQMYPGTHNFRDETDGETSITDWSLTRAEIIASLDGHRKVLELDPINPDNSTVWHTFADGDQTSGTYEFWVYTSDATNTIYMRGYDDGKTNIGIYFYIGADTFRYIDAGGTNIIVAAVDDTWYHVKIDFECGAGAYLGLAADTYYITIDGTQYGAYDFQNAVTEIEALLFQCTTDAAYNCYIDALGFSWDSDYAVGDNVHWRHYFDQDSDFESADVGDDGDDISFIYTSGGDAAHFIITQEFNEHKKIGSFFDDDTYSTVMHQFGDDYDAGIIEFWFKSNDTGACNLRIYFQETATLNFYLKFLADQITDWDGAVIGTTVDDTWYHIKVQWYDDNTADVWIDNVLVRDGKAFTNNMVSGLNDVTFRMYSNDNTKIAYIDAWSESWNNDVGDNRTLDYNATYTKVDITDDIIVSKFKKDEYGWSKVSITDYGSNILTTNQLLQLYDENSVLRFEGLLFDTIPGSIPSYIYSDLNKPFLTEAITYAASAAEDANATFLAICTNVGQEDGRCIYYTEHDPSGNRTPNYRGNKPFREIAAERASEAATILIIKANGVCFLDDDAVPPNGAYTITDASTSELELPFIDEYDAQINYVKVLGAMDPATGAPFYGVSEDTAAQAIDDIIRYTRRFYDLQSDADCLARATAIRTGVGFAPKTAIVPLLSVYGEPGEIINLASALKSFTATNCYIETVTLDLNVGLSYFVLNTGLLSSNDVAMEQLPLPGQTSDDISETIYETDIVTVNGRIRAVSGGTWIGDRSYIQIDFGEMAGFNFGIGDKIDKGSDRPLTIVVIHSRADANNDIPDINITLQYLRTDGSGDVDTILNSEASTFPAVEQNKRDKKIFSVSTALLEDYDEVYFYIENNEVGREIYILSTSLTYYMKRG